MTDVGIDGVGSCGRTRRYGVEMATLLAQSAVGASLRLYLEDMFPLEHHARARKGEIQAQTLTGTTAAEANDERGIKGPDGMDQSLAIEFACQSQGLFDAQPLAVYFEVGYIVQEFSRITAETETVSLILFSCQLASAQARKQVYLIDKAEYGLDIFHRQYLAEMDCLHSSCYKSFCGPAHDRKVQKTFSAFVDMRIGPCFTDQPVHAIPESLAVADPVCTVILHLEIPFLPVAVFHAEFAHRSGIIAQFMIEGNSAWWAMQRPLCERLNPGIPDTTPEGYSRVLPTRRKRT